MLKNLAGVTRGAKLAAATAVVAMVLAVAPAQAQDASVSVPAGQTSTVSLPVPVDVSYAGEGWNINASGGSATITAPPEGGQVTVPVTYEGTTISLTLVADGSVTQEDLNNAGEDIANGGDGGAVLHGGGAGDGSGEGAGGGDNGDGGSAGEDSGSGTGADGGAASGNGTQGGVPGGDPANNPAAAGGVDVSQAEYINLDATIEGQTITAQMGVMQALDLYNRFKDTDEAGVTLRYLNAKGEFIKGVKRKVDKSSRTLELTYPEGQTPDNPFIMELVRDSDNAAVLVVTLTDPNKETAGDVPNPDNGSGEGANADSKNSSSILPWAIGAGGVLLLIVLGWLLSRRRKSSQETG
ncbi:hypothetical protein [Corynebacterium sp. HMSC077D03]|uniref:hypothetical protein n=1 Tax=Corynebacterium sp. HMSC077D03 TaxID=1739392 RepID=UPI0008A3FB2E|nr:hypothetical protein [Corynebacterium sp. HMSC077D03]OFR37994.1 hypothetical protein HMPREF2888_01815 [Corynebacterium sp. HMSC077D03]